MLLDRGRILDWGEAFDRMSVDSLWIRRFILWWLCDRQREETFWGRQLRGRFWKGSSVEVEQQMATFRSTMRKDTGLPSPQTYDNACYQLKYEENNVIVRTRMNSSLFRLDDRVAADRESLATSRFLIFDLRTMQKCSEFVLINWKQLILGIYIVLFERFVE